jgi:hypothetical protein
MFFGVRKNKLAEPVYLQSNRVFFINNHKKGEGLAAGRSPLEVGYCREERGFEEFDHCAYF